MGELNTKLPPRIPQWSIMADTRQISFLVLDCPCWTVQRSFPLGGPWEDICKGAGATPAVVEHPAGGSAAHYRVIEREC